MALSVIGAGFGRTGTNSLKLALEILGFKPCYHMNEVFDHPDHVLLWKDKVLGEPIDWESIFTNYQAAVDWPVCSYWQELSEFYPDAKVLLSVREPEKWHASMAKTIFPELSHPPPTTSEHLQVRHEMARMLILEQTFESKMSDMEHVIDIYLRHNKTVQERIPKERLLVYEVSQGWPPLCDFLKIEIPDKPFPQLNSKDEFQKARF